MPTCTCTVATGGVTDLASYLSTASQQGSSPLVSPAHPLPVVSADATLPPLSFTAFPYSLGHLWCQSMHYAGQGSELLRGRGGLGTLAFALDASRLARHWLGGASHLVAREVQECLSSLAAEGGQHPAVLLVGSAAALSPVGEAGVDAPTLLAAQQLLEGAPSQPALHSPSHHQHQHHQHHQQAPLTEAQCACLYAFLRLLAVGLGASLAALPAAAPLSTAPTTAAVASAATPPAASPPHPLSALLFAQQPPPAPVFSPPHLALLPHGQDTAALALAALPSQDAAWGAALAAASPSDWPRLLLAAPAPPSFQGASRQQQQLQQLPPALAARAAAAMARPSGAWAGESAQGAAAALRCHAGTPWESWAEAVVAGKGGGEGSSSATGAAGSRSVAGGRPSIGRLGVGPRASMGGRRSLGGGQPGEAGSLSSSRSSSVASVASVASAAGSESAAPVAVAVAGVPAASKADPKKFFSLLAAGGGKPPPRGAAKESKQ